MRDIVVCVAVVMRASACSRWRDALVMPSRHDEHFGLSDCVSLRAHPRCLRCACRVLTLRARRSSTLMRTLPPNGHTQLFGGLHTLHVVLLKVC